MDSAIQLFKQLPDTNEQEEKYFDIIREAVLGGETDPVQFYATVSRLERLFKKLKTDALIKDEVITEAGKYTSKTFETASGKFTVKEAGVSWDYSGCDCDELEDVTRKIKELENEMKIKAKPLMTEKLRLEKLLQTITPEDEIFDKISGLKMNPAVKSSTTTIAVTLK